jgi:hypothetical protein
MRSYAGGSDASQGNLRAPAQAAAFVRAATVTAHSALGPAGRSRRAVATAGARSA